jgi:hypothetical protein
MDNLVGRYRLKSVFEATSALTDMLEFGCIQYTYEKPLEVPKDTEPLATGSWPVTPRQRIYQNVANNTKGFAKGAVLPALVANDDFMGAITKCGVKTVEDYFSGKVNIVPSESDLLAVFTNPTIIAAGYKVIGNQIEYLVNFPELLRNSF